MAELVTLPSGAVAPLERTSIGSLLSCDGSLLGLARCVLAHDELDAERLSPADLYFVAEWAVEAFVDGSGGPVLGELGAGYGEPPSRRVGITEPVLAVRLDRGCLHRYLEESQPRRK